MPETSTPLLLTRDPELLDYLRRLAVAAGHDPHVASTPAQARRWWSTAAVVVVGDDVLAELPAAGLARRAGVVVAVRGEQLPWAEALAAGAELVVHLATDDHALLRVLTSAPRPDAGRGRVVGVIGGSGGAGASVLATGLALAAARGGHDTLLAEVDPASGGLDLAVAAEEHAGARWSDLGAVTGVLAPDVLRSALPVAHGIAVLSVDRDTRDPVPLEAVPAVLDSATAAYDVVVVDLPRFPREVLDVVLPRCDRVLLVVTTEVRGAASGRRALRALSEVAAPSLVVRAVPHGALDPLDVEQWLGVSAVAELQHDPRLARSLEHGEVPGSAARSPLARVCQVLVHELVA